MYATSESYKEAIKSKVITDSISGEIALKDGTTIIISDENLVSGSLRVIHELCDDYKIGTFNLGAMKIGFRDDSALLHDFSGAKIKISYNIETSDGIETIPMGIFIADGTSVKRRRSTVSLSAYDYGILFDSIVSTSVRNMTGTAEELIKASCEKCGVEFGEIDATLPNSSVEFSPLSPQIQSYRDLIGWCATVLCGYAVIDREGKLKIISSRYKVADDNTTILENKKLTADERMSIYSTDTRAWIAQISAYSGDKQKIYKTYVSLSDEQAARAIYYLDKNPLLEGKSESECDEINKEWLYFIDTFMQRGINAEIYGDPSLDVGDVIRCCDGDIDQRKSVVGLITKQEWRYRNFHTIVTAAAQLSDGFPEEINSDESGTDEETSESLSPLKVVSQVEKRLSKASSSGGVGVFVNDEKNAERFNDYSEETLAEEAGDYSHAEGEGTKASGAWSHAEGYKTEASDRYSHAEGAITKASDWYSHAEGKETTASGEASHSEGKETIASGMYSHAEGCGTIASGIYAHAEGFEAEATIEWSHAEGYRTKVEGVGPGHAEGANTVASGTASHAEGGKTVASGASSHAEGYNTEAKGDFSHAGGEGTIASTKAQTAIGSYNEEDENALFIIGCGTGPSDRKNAFVVDKSGNVKISGSFSSEESGGEKYDAGEGISIAESEISENKSISVKPATSEELGGVKIGDGLEISSDGTLSSSSAYSAGKGVTISDNKKITLNAASNSALGGIIVGDGLEIDSSGKLSVKEEESDSGKDYTAGVGVTISEEKEITLNAASNSALGGIIVGDGLEIDSSGKLSVKEESADSGKSYDAGDGITITEGEENNVISVNIDNDTITFDGGKLKSNSKVATADTVGVVKPDGKTIQIADDGTLSLILSESSGGVSVGNLIMIDHAPTAADLTGGNCVIVQYNPESTALIEGETSSLFSATAVFVEVGSGESEPEEPEANPPDGGYVCSSADELLFEITGAGYGTRQYKKKNDGIAYCAYYYTNNSSHWFVPVLISETEDAVEYYSTYNNASQGVSGSFEYNGKTLYYCTTGNYSFSGYVEDTSGLGRHKLSQEYAQGSLEPALELAAIIYG